MIHFPVLDWQTGYGNGLFLPQQLGIHGRWSEVRVWHNHRHLAAFRAGARRVKPLFDVDIFNGITDLGIHHVLNRFTDNAGPELTLAPWHTGLIDNSGFTGVSPGDTQASHTGWVENQDYDETVRELLGFGTAATRTITAQVQFTMNQIRTIQGLHVSEDNTKGGTTGLLFSTALFAVPPPLVVGNVLTANYSLSD